MANGQISAFLIKQFDARATQLGGRIRTTAQTLHTIAEHLRADATTQAGADMADRSADYVDRAGLYLKNSDFDALVADAEHFSRERPWTVAGIGLAAGILGARLLKATAARRHASPSRFVAPDDAQTSDLADNTIAIDAAALSNVRRSKRTKKGSRSGL